MVLCFTLCLFVLVFFSPFSIAITSLGEERANLSAFRTFVRFVLVWICRFPLPLSVWEGLGLWLWHSLGFSLTFILFYETICFMCYFILVFFSPFSMAITSPGKERANLNAFRTFVRFVLVWICRFPLPLGVWEGLRFVIVALLGLYLFLLFLLCFLRQTSCPTLKSVILWFLFAYLVFLRWACFSLWCINTKALWDCSEPFSMMI